MQNRLVTRYVGKQVLLAILMVLGVILGLDILAAIVDELGDLEGNYTFFALTHLYIDDDSSAN